LSASVPVVAETCSLGLVPSVLQHQQAGQSGPQEVCNPCRASPAGVPRLYYSGHLCSCQQYHSRPGIHFPGEPATRGLIFWT